MLELFELLFHGVGGFFSFIGTVFWIIMMIDCLRSSIRHKGRWMIFMLITNWVGAVVYFFVIRPDSVNRLLRYLQNMFRPQPQFWTSATPPQAPPREAATNDGAYQEYQQGYSAQSYQSSYTATPGAQPTAPTAEPPAYYPLYEQPQASYPEMPPIQQ